MGNSVVLIVFPILFHTKGSDISYLGYLRFSEHDLNAGEWIYFRSLALLSSIVLNSELRLSTGNRQRLMRDLLYG